MSIAEPPVGNFSIPALSALCEEIDRVLALPKSVQESMRGDINRLCEQAGIEPDTEAATAAVLKHLADRRYTLGEELDRLKALPVVIDGPGNYIAEAGADEASYNEQVFRIAEPSNELSGLWTATAPDGWEGYFRSDGENANGVDIRIVRKCENDPPAEVDPAVAEKAAKEAAKLAKYQAEWTARNAVIKDSLVALDLQIHDIDCEIAPLNTAKRELNKKKSELLIELGYRRNHGMPTELPKSGDGLKQPELFGDTEDDGPLLEWSDAVDQVTGDEYAYAKSAKLGEAGDPFEWRIDEAEGAYTLHVSSPELNPPDASQAFGDQELAKAEAERLERIIREGEKSTAAETDPRRLAIRLERLGLPKGIIAKLADAAIDTLGDVAACTRINKPLTSIPGIGPEKAAAIADAIAAFDAEYAKDPDVAIAKYGG
jgi:hypothetical protein